MSGAGSIGPLTPADEQFTHQITDTHARVGTTERSWTEKVCAMAAAKDGSIQLSLGIGKYNNRNVMDAYAGVSRVSSSGPCGRAELLLTTC